MPATNIKTLKTHEFFFSLDFEKVLYEIVFGRKSLLHFFVVVVYYTFSKCKNVTAQKLCGGSCGNVCYLAHFFIGSIEILKNLYLETFFCPF